MDLRSGSGDDLASIAQIQAASPEASQWDVPEYLKYDLLVAVCAGRVAGFAVARRVAPAGSPFAPGDLVVGVVRRPDPVPCANCAAGEWDMCKNGLYTERGISGRDGYAAER